MIAVRYTHYVFCLSGVNLSRYKYNSMESFHIFVLVLALIVFGVMMFNIFMASDTRSKLPVKFSQAFKADNQYEGYSGEGQRELRIYAQEPWFSEIKAGRKIVEARVGGPDFYNKNIGSPAVVMVPGGDSHPTQITAVRHYPDLENFLEKEDLKKYAPHLKTKGEAKAAYLATKDKSGVSIYGPDRIKEKGGIVAVELAAPKK